VETAREGTFRSLRTRNFRLFILGQVISATGFWIQSVAAPFLVLQLTNSGIALGIDTGLTFLPILLFGAWGGLVADRFDNRRLQIATQVAFAVPAAILWTLVFTGTVQVWMVYVLSFVSGCVTAVDMPTRQSFYLEMVGRDQLTNAMSLNTATFTGTRMVGPALGGVLIKAVGVAPVFLINAVSYLAVVVALLMMRVSDLTPRERASRARGQIREGIRYAWHTPELRLPLLTMAATFLFAWNFIVLLPLLAKRSFDGDAGTYGIMLAVFGAGSLAGSLLMASRATRPNTPRLAGLGVAMGALSIGVGLAPTLAAAWALLPALGGVSIAFAITGNSTLQLTAATEMRGRVMSLYSVIFLGSTPIGGPIAGVVGQHLGPRVGLVGGGVIAILAGVLAALAWRARWV
jgi:MFS family permease